jgi:hypothetical protein
MTLVERPLVELYDSIQQHICQYHSTYFRPPTHLELSMDDWDSFKELLGETAPCRLAGLRVLLDPSMRAGLFRVVGEHATLGAARD